MKFLIVLAAVVAVALGGTVDIQLKHQVASGEVTEAIIELPQIMSQVESSVSLRSLKGAQKVSAMVSMLEGLTSAAQASYVTVAKSLGLETQQLWISNVILVKGLTTKTLAQLAATPGEFIIRPQNTASIHPSIEIKPIMELEFNNITQTYQWGVEKIRAPQAHAVTDGAGCVAGVIDTGVNGMHVALMDSFAGVWADPYYNTATPTDQHGHGSHCMGTICGRANGVGVAPGATWVSCRGLNHQGSGTEAALLSCAQTMTSANPKPDFVSNSWGGGNNNAWYNTAVSAWRMADIIPIFAIGNSGAGCRSANSPGDQPNLISCGATDVNDAMASFSSRGPSGAGLLKPELSAPGVNIVSCGTGASNYATMSGTSMATPHVAGAVCLLRANNPAITFDEIYEVLRMSTFKPTLTNPDRNCGLPDPGSDHPNHSHGWGRIDIGAALGV